MHLLLYLLILIVATTDYLTTQWIFVNWGWILVALGGTCVLFHLGGFLTRSKDSL